MDDSIKVSKLTFEPLHTSLCPDQELKVTRSHLFCLQLTTRGKIKQGQVHKKNMGASFVGVAATPTKPLLCNSLYSQLILREKLLETTIFLCVFQT